MNESILTKSFLKRVGSEGLIIGIMTSIGFLIGLNMGGELLGSTMAFGTLCLSRLTHGYNCKSGKPILFKKEFFNNKAMQYAFGVGFVLMTAVMLIPALQGIFKVQTLTLSQLGIVYGLALCNLVLIQLKKFLNNMLKNRK